MATNKIQLGSLTRLAFGRQDNLATPAEGTRRAHFRPAPLTRNTQFWRGDGTRGRQTVAATAYKPIKTRDRSSFTLTSELEIRDILRPLLASVDGDPSLVTPTGATDARNVVFRPDQAETPEIVYFSMLRSTSDAAEPAGVLDLRYPKGFVTGWNLSEDASGAALIAENWQLGAEEEHAFPDLAAPTDSLALGINAFWLFSLHNTFADAIADSDALTGGATSPLAGGSQVYGQTIGHTSGWAFTQSREGSLDYDEVASGRRPMTMAGSVYLDSQITQMARVEAGNLEEFRYARMEIKSPVNVEGSTPYRLVVVMACTHGDGSLLTREAEDGDMLSMAFNLRSAGVGNDDIYIQATVHEDDATAWGIS